MQKEVLRHLLAQNRTTSSYSFDRITEQNSRYRVNEEAASVGFIYRHIGETLNAFGRFLGVPTDVVITTIGRQDEGQPFDLATSRMLVARGYETLERVIETTPDAAWLETVDTPFFGPVSRARLFAHALFHNSNHAGQISLTLARGK